MEKGSSKVTEEPVKEEKPATTVNNKEEDKESAQTSSFELEKGSDSVSVNTPPPDASIAEAKPVALSVAGVGGVASAKPVSTLLKYFKIYLIIFNKVQIFSDCHSCGWSRWISS